jgi:PAS domain S-box-containing protein
LNMAHFLSFMRQCKKNPGPRPEEHGIDDNVRELLDLIQQTEAVAARIHGVMDSGEIFRIIEEELGKLRYNNAVILQLSEDKKKAFVKILTIPGAKMKIVDKLMGSPGRNITIDLQKSVVLRRVVDHGETYSFKTMELIKEILPGPLGNAIAKITGHDKKSSIVSPIIVHGEITGMVAIDTPVLVEYFSLSVKNLARHFSAALELASADAERKRAEQTLAESEQNFRRMFEITSEGVTLISPETGKFIAANPAMCAMFGYSEEEFRLLTPEDITPPEAKEIMRMSMKTLFDGGIVPDHEGISIKKDGTKVNVIVSNRTMSWKGEYVFHITFKDVTFLKAIQEQLKKKNSEVLEFTNMVSHDLKKPLTTMNIVLGLAKKNAFGPLNPDGVEAIDTGIEASKYMQEMLEDLLACARLESGTQELTVEKTGFRELADEVLGRLKFQIEEKKISVTLPDADVSVRADRKQLIRVLMNLVGNAINYIGSEPDKFIHVGWEQKNGTPVFMVADNGIGIPDKSKESLFGKFKRGSNVSGVQGTGLGLSIVKGIVEAHGGKIWFESEVGKGTTFYFTLAGKEEKS